MQSKIKFLLATLVFCIIYPLVTNSQIAISKVSEISKIKKGTTYFVLGETNSEKAKEYINAIKSSWTISKIEFINYSEIENVVTPESYFLSLGATVRTATFVNTNQDGSRRNGNDFTNSHLYLELWTCNEKYFERKNKKREIRENDRIQVARIEIYPNFETLKDLLQIFRQDFDPELHFRNWGPGYIKNYIQMLMYLLNKGQTRSLFAETCNESEMKKLRKSILYVPDYVLIKFNKFTGAENKNRDEEDIFEDYNYRHKLVSNEVLNQKILTDTAGFYYLIYVKSSTDKFVSVVNSLTGEMIYTSYTPVSYNFRAGDMKSIRKKIE